MNLTEKLLYIQQNLKAPKSQYNKFGGFYYRSCEDILEAVKPLLKEMKTVLLISDDIVLKGERFYVEATATLKDTESGEEIHNKGCAREAADNKAKMDAAQVTGSSSTYARKYALNGLFCIDDSRDPDMAEPEGRGSRQAADQNRQKQQQAPQDNKGRTGANAGGKENPGGCQAGFTGSPESTGQGFARAEYISNIRAEMERTGVTEQELCQKCGIRSLDEMTAGQYRYIMGRFRGTATKGQKAAG